MQNTLINVVVSSGFFIEQIIWKNIFGNNSIICVDNLRECATTTLADYASAIIDLIDVNKPTVFIGHSYGAGLIIHTASLYHGNISKIILLNGIIPNNNQCIFECYSSSKQNILNQLTRLNYCSGMIELQDNYLYKEYLLYPDTTQKNIELLKSENLLLLTTPIINILNNNRKFPVIYLVSKNDRLTDSSIQIEFSKRANADTLIYQSGGHLSCFFSNKDWILCES